MENEMFKAGQLVIFKAGESPIMEIVKVEERYLVCVWLETTGIKKRHRFIKTTLKVYTLGSSFTNQESSVHSK